MILNIAHIHSSNNNGVCTGHYLPLARLYKDLFSDMCSVRIAGGPLYTQSFMGEDILELPHSIDVRSNGWRCLIKMISNARYLFKQTKGQIVVLQDGKPVANHICVLLCYRKCNLYLIKYHTDGVNKLWKRFLFSLIKHRIKGIICPNDEIGRLHGLPYCVVPDYIYTGDGSVNAGVVYSNKKYDFCCLGRIESEKGVLEVAEKLKNTKFKLLIAGNPNPSQLAKNLKKLCNDAQNIELKLGYLNDEDYENALRESRYAILNYHGVYAKRSSGVVYDMLFHGVPVVGKNCGALSFVTLYNLGFLYDNLSDFNPNEVLLEEKYNKYLKKIEDYCLKNKENKKKIARFLGINN